MERWLNSPWDEPNNGDSFFYSDENQQELRAAHDLGRKEPVKLFEEFLNFAERGSVWSTRQVGTSLLNGSKVPINRSEAERWLRRAYEAGDEGACLL